MDDTRLPTDEFSRELERLMRNPAAMSSASTIDVQTMLGNTESWIVKTVRVEGEETLFVTHVDATQGRRFVLPPKVTAAQQRQHEQLIALGRKRGANKAAATRKAKGSK